MEPEGGAESATPTEKHSSNLVQGSGHGGGFHMNPIFLVAWESIAVISGSGSDNTTTPGGGKAAESSSPEGERALRCRE